MVLSLEGGKLARTRGLATSLLAASLLCGLPALGQPRSGSSNESRDQAVKLANSGYDLMRQGMYDEAIVLFHRADQRFHSPMFIYFVGQAEERRGNLVEALEQYRKVIDEPPARDAPTSFLEAKENATKALEALEKRVPTWELRVVGHPIETLTITLDDKPVTREKLGTKMFCNPGEHLLKVLTPGGETKQSAFSAAEGQSSEVAIEFTTRPKPESEPRESPTGEPWRITPWVAYGIGGAGLVMSAVTGILFVGRASDLKDQCPQDRCDPSLEEEGNAVRTLGTVSTVGFVLGAAGAAAGTALLVLAPKPKDERPSEKVAPSLRLGIGSVGLSSAF